MSWQTWEEELTRVRAYKHSLCAAVGTVQLTRSRLRSCELSELEDHVISG